MLLSEAIWLKKNIEKYLSPDLKPVLNLGSSTSLYRNKIRPFINELIIYPIERITSSKVIHSDLKNDSGVDLPGDIYDENFQKTIIDKKFRVIICTNFVPYARDPAKAISIVGSLVDTNGLIFMTAARLSPYYPDPVDVFFRPSPEELFNYFDPDKFVLIEKEIIPDESYFIYLIKRPKLFINRIIRIFIPFYKFKLWCLQMSYLPNYFKKFKVSCIVVKRIS